MPVLKYWTCYTPNADGKGFYDASIWAAKGGRMDYYTGGTVKLSKRGKRVPLSPGVRDIVLGILIPKHGCICWYCGVKLGMDEIHVDHIKPLSKGGADNVSNLALACLSCNRAKWDLSLTVFFKWGNRLRKLNSFPVILDKTKNAK